MAWIYIKYSMWSMWVSSSIWWFYDPITNKQIQDIDLSKHQTSLYEYLFSNGMITYSWMCIIKSYKNIFY